MSLHIKNTRYGPSIYDGRKKLEGPFADLIGPTGAEARLETLLERQSPHRWLPVGTHVIVPKTLYRPSSINPGGTRTFFRKGNICEQLVGGGVAVKFDEYPNAVDYTRREAEQFQTTS